MHQNGDKATHLLANGYDLEWPSQHTLGLDGWVRNISDYLTRISPLGSLECRAPMVPQPMTLWHHGCLVQMWPLSSASLHLSRIS